MFIVLEGIDCCGKSTVASLLAKQTNSVLYKTPPKNIVKERDEIDASASPIDHYRFYLKGIKTASREIWNLIASGRNVICDRYWLTTHVYHTVMGVSVDINDFSSITLPNLTVLLLVSTNVQTKRFLEIGMSIGDKRMVNHQAELAREYKRMITRQNIPQLIISTDYDCSIEIVEKIKSHINVYM